MPRRKRRNTCGCGGAKRANPIDPLSVGLQATSLGYFLSVARELQDIKKGARRSNPQIAKRIGALEKKLRRNAINWPDTLAFGAGSAIGAAVGGAIIEPIIEKARKGVRSNPTLLIASNPSGNRKNRSLAKKSRARRPKKHTHDNKDYKAALKKYREFFNDDEPMDVIPVEVPDGMKLPKYMIALGRASEVTYKPDDHTSKKGVPFVHKFGEEGGNEPYLVTDANGEILTYVDGSFFVTDWIRD